MHEAGFEVDDFRVVDLEDEPTAKEQHPNTGTVTVHRMTGHAITYRAGHGSTWVADFFWLISTQANTASHKFERLRWRLRNACFGPGRAFYPSTLGFDSPPLHLPKRRIRIPTYDPRRPFWA